MGYYNLLLLFFMIHLWINNAIGSKDCPAGCSCLSTLVSCSQCNVTGLFEVMPSWVEVLDLGSNKLNDDFTCDLSHLENLTDLKLNKNSFSNIPTLGYLKNLRKLSISHNEIIVMKVDSLSNLPVLEDLNLNGNHIEKLSNNSFPDTNVIKILHLSNNKIKSIQKGAFDSLRHLLKLKINKNRITNIPKHLFKHQEHLKILELNENKIQKMDGLIFQGLDSLDTLRIRGNEIRFLKDAVFYGLNSLSTLQLDRNSINAIAKRWMYGLSTLKTFSLTWNNLTTIEQGCWEFNGNLEELDLSNNGLEGIYGSTFEHLSDLKILKLDNNKISTIAETAFSHMPALEVLQLSHNQISWTVEDMNGPFAKLGNLQRFSLANNHIKSISNKAFVGLKMLSFLDLNNNNITSLQEHAFDSLQNLREVHLNSSSLLCDCKLQWLTQWLRRSVQGGAVRASCAYPAWLRGRPLLALTRENFTCNDSPKPRVLEHPRSQLAIKGSDARLHCKAVSSRYRQHHVDEKMNFLWRWNDTNITDPIVKEYVSAQDEHSIVASSELLIPNITNSARGKYQCIVSNIFGTTYSQKAKISIVIPPRFTKRPSNITVNAGATAKLECSASGEPVPQIAWQKDGGNDFPAARERRMHVMPADDAFFIINSNISDMGVYSCTAQNPAGTVISNASLTVLEAPSFVKAMVNREISVGESAVLQCMVSGSPKPSLIWLKDGSPIARTERHFFIDEDQVLVIVSVVQTDEGMYECEITNSLGTMKGSTTLRVLPPVVLVVNEEDMMGIIIITVVCCAVGTSIIWVVFIYQTRKRLNSALPHFPADSVQMAPLSTDAERATTHIFADNISERSSCKDSGTGDSAKRSSLEAIPSDEFPNVNKLNGIPVYTDPPRVPLDEAHSLLRDETRGTHFCYESSPDCVVNFSTIAQCDIQDEPSRTYPYS